MGKPITFAQDPIAVFLEYQLPQMIAQSKEADKNRMHQEKMVQVREESAIRIGEANQKNLQENTLLEFQQDLLKEDYDNTKSAITKQEEEFIGEQDQVTDKLDISEDIHNATESGLDIDQAELDAIKKEFDDIKNEAAKEVKAEEKADDASDTNDDGIDIC